MADAKSKTSWQVFLLVWQSKTRYPHGYRLLKYKSSKNKKDSKTKKNYSFTTNSNSTNGNQSGQTLVQSSKKDSRLYRNHQRGQSSDTPATSDNVTVIKNCITQCNRDMGRVKYYVCHKKGHDVSKCTNREPKN